MAGEPDDGTVSSSSFVDDDDDDDDDDVRHHYRRDNGCGGMRLLRHPRQPVMADEVDGIGLPMSSIP